MDNFLIWDDLFGILKSFGVMCNCNGNLYLYIISKLNLPTKHKGERKG